MLSGLEDLDGDGLGEIAVGEPSWTRPDGKRAGRASVHGFDLPGAITSFGRGCSGSQPLTLIGSGSARPGGMLRFDASRTCVIHYVAFCLGFSDSDWNGTPLPFPLGSFGDPGCALLVSLDTVLATKIAIPGSAVVTWLQLPNDPALIGNTAYVQLLEGMPSSPTRTSNALSIRVGNR